ncbi:MAG: hypothetical protein HY291_20410 [Planctomycetes bacterium]|nr:hypothetical protein [Planctomycetota bacterium]
MSRILKLAVIVSVLLAGVLRAEESPGVVSHIKVLSDKVEDVTTLEDWKKTYIKDGMSDQEKAIAVWKTVVKYRHQDSPPNEFMAFGENVHDPLKTIHVYGYGMCCCASSNIEGLARYIGLQARGRIINQHSVPEVFYDNAWHLFDASLMNYFTKTDGKVASVDEIHQAVTDWFAKSPENGALRGNDNKLRAFAMNEGWKKGPELLAGSPFYDKNGINPAGWHGWPSNMQEYDWNGNKLGGVYEYGPSMGYQLNIQLREGEKLTRNWFNQKMNVPGDPNDELMSSRKSLGFQAKLGDLAPGRVGNGTLEYEVPLASGAFRKGALAADNLACTAEDKAAPAVHVKDAASPGVLIVRMASSYIYLDSTLSFKAAVGSGGAITVSFSQNNGLDWTEVSKIDAAGPQTVDLKKYGFLRYDYRLKFEFKGAGTGLDTLNIKHGILHSQAPLPLLTEGENTVTFNAGAQEGTITYEGAMKADLAKGKQVTFMEYHPELKGLNEAILGVGDSGAGEGAVNVETPGEMTRIRMNAHWRARAAKDGYEIQVSFDDGKTWKPVDKLEGPTAACTKYITIGDVPSNTKKAKLKLVGHQQNTACIFDLRIDADYKEPNGGFRPVKITYVWDEGGQKKEDVHVVKKASESYTIKIAGKPLMKSVVLEVEK